MPEAGAKGAALARTWLGELFWPWKVQGAMAPDSKDGLADARALVGQTIGAEDVVEDDEEDDEEVVMVLDVDVVVVVTASVEEVVSWGGTAGSWHCSFAA